MSLVLFFFFKLLFVYLREKEIEWGEESGSWERKNKAEKMGEVGNLQGQSAHLADTGKRAAFCAEHDTKSAERTLLSWGFNTDNDFCPAHDRNRSRGAPATALSLLNQDALPVHPGEKVREPPLDSELVLPSPALPWEAEELSN